MEVRLVLAVSAVRVLAVLVEPGSDKKLTLRRSNGPTQVAPESQVPFRYRLVLEYPHRGLDPRLLLLGAEFVRAQRPLVQVGRHRCQGARHVFPNRAVLAGQVLVLDQPRVLEHQLVVQAGDRGRVSEVQEVRHGLLGHEGELGRQVRGEVREVTEPVEGRWGEDGRVGVDFRVGLGVLERLEGGDLDFGRVRFIGGRGLLVVVVFGHLAV